MTRLQDLPTPLLWHAINTNPTALFFPWTVREFAGKDVPRWAILDELSTRVGYEYLALLHQSEIERGREVFSSKGRDREDLEQRNRQIQFLRNQSESRHKRLSADGLITGIITTSPVPSHPSTQIIDTTLSSIDFHLPTMRSFILADGIRAEQELLLKPYRDYKKRLLLPKASLVSFSDYSHQAGMLRSFIDKIDTPLVFFTEHDIPLNHESINWVDVFSALLTGTLDIVRFCIDENRKENREYGVGLLRHGDSYFLRTTQYDSLAHVSRLDCLKRFVNIFHEGRIHLCCDESEAWFADKKNAKVGLYYPRGNPQRCYSLGGRGLGLEGGEAGPKLPMQF